MKLLFLLVSTVLPLFSNGDVGMIRAHKYQGNNVNGTEEYRLYADLETGLASFFDNDSDSVVALKNVKFLDSKPRVTQYIFEGTDASEELITIVFNISRDPKVIPHSATITFSDGDVYQAESVTVDDSISISPDRLENKTPQLKSKTNSKCLALFKEA